MSPQDLRELMSGLRIAPDPNLLVGTATGDDAAVYRLTDELALVQTLDYVTPMTDDPFLYGQIAAANALSDVYAMGGRPLTAMNICSFPRAGDAKAYRRILEGGLSKIQEAGAVLAGGQTVQGMELVYGLSVTGLVRPQEVWSNAGARPGDVLILTKPIGTGAIINAVKQGKGGVSARDALAEACGPMAELNKIAAETARAFDVHAATDVTGFGLAGHAWNIARESGVGLRLSWSALPRYAETLRLIASGVKTSLTSPNRVSLEGHLRFGEGFSPDEETLLFDPQTSGGLLLAVDRAQADACLAALRKAGVRSAARVGEAIEGPARIEVSK